MVLLITFKQTKMKTIKKILITILEIVVLFLIGIEFLIKTIFFLVTLKPSLLKSNSFIIPIYDKFISTINSPFKYTKWNIQYKCGYCDSIVNPKASWCTKCSKANPETGKVLFYVLKTREKTDKTTGKTEPEMIVTYLLLILLSFSNCQKKNATPQPIPVNNAAPCQVMPDKFTGKFYTYNTARVDTLTINFVQNNCPNISNSNKYELINLGEVMTTWGVGMEYRKYYVNCDESTQKGKIIDTLNIDLYDYDNLRISVKDNGVFTPFLILKRK